MKSRAAPAHRAIPLRLALAIPLVCLLLAGALWVGQSLRAYRAPTASPAPTDGPQAAAAPTPQLRQQPTQLVRLPAGFFTQTSSVVPSPDGEYLAGRTTDFSRLAIVHVDHERDALELRSELALSLPDLGFVAWMPDSRSFIAQSTKLAAPGVPPKGPPLPMKTADVYRVDLSGAKTKLGETMLGPFALSPDGTRLATFDGYQSLVVLRTDGSGALAMRDPNGIYAPFILGWDDGGSILRFDSREPPMLHRIGPTGTSSDVALAVASVTDARWSPDRRAALVTAQFGCDCPGLLTDRVTRLPADAYAAWVGPHSVLTRGGDERAGTLDVLSGARTTLDAKMRSDTLRILAVSLPYVLWLDQAKGVPHLLDLTRGRDTGLGLNPAPVGAFAVPGGRFYAWSDTRLQLIDAGAWWSVNVDAHPTPSPAPLADDQTGVPAGSLRVEIPEGGWSVVIPRSWYRRSAPLHGGEFLSYDPQGMDFSGNLPPPGETRVVIEMPNDDGAADLAAYAIGHGMPFGGARPTAGVPATVAGLPGYGFVTRGGGPSPWDMEIRNWLVRSPYFGDRVVVIQAVGTARTAEVDALIASLRFFTPTPPAPAIAPTRAEVIAKYSAPSFSAVRVDRVDVKIVRWKDLEKAAPIGHSGVNDPDELTWVVVVHGEIHPVRRGGPLGRPTPAPDATPETYHYELHAFSAVGGPGGLYSCCGPDSTPTWWDSLADLGY